MAAQNRSHGFHVVSSRSPSRIRRVRLISLGMTTRPSSSILRTIPVARNVPSLLDGGATLMPHCFAVCLCIPSMEFGGAIMRRKDLPRRAGAPRCQMPGGKRRPRGRLTWGGWKRFAKKAKPGDAGLRAACRKSSPAAIFSARTRFPCASGAAGETCKETLLRKASESTAHVAGFGFHSEGTEGSVCPVARREAPALWAVATEGGKATRSGAAKP